MLNNLILASFLVGIFFLPIHKGPSQVGLFTSAFLLIFQKLSLKKSLFDNKQVYAGYFIFFLFIFLSLTNAEPENFKIGLKGISKWLKYFMFFWLGVNISNSHSIRNRTFWILICSMTIVCFDGFYQLFTGTDLFTNQSLNPGRILRMKSAFNSPNSLACFLLFALPAIFYLILRSKKTLLKVGLTVGMLIFFSCFILSYSRAAFLGLIVSILIQLIGTRKYRIRLILLFLLIAALLFTIAPIRMNFLNSLHLNDITISSRINYWKVTFNMILAHPWLGNGINLYHTLFPNFAPPTETYRGYAHNCYLQMWAEIGLLGLIAFLLPIFLTLKQSRKALADIETNQKTFLICLRISLIAYLIQSFFDTNLYSLQTATLFWIFWGLFTGSVYQKKESI